MVLNAALDLIESAGPVLLMTEWTLCDWKQQDRASRTGRFGSARLIVLDALVSA
jgi:hypothetical protein